MSEVKQFHLREGTLVEGKSLGCLNVYLASDYDQLKAENEQQAARIAELQKDAARYRWLLEKSGFGIRRNGVTELTVAFYEIQPDNIGQLSFAIDAAMGSEE